jgi:hypothetical protein
MTVGWPWEFRTIFERESARCRAALASGGAVVTDRDLAPLPDPVQRFLRRVGVVGRPRVRGFEARFDGRFRNGVGARWLRFVSEQRNFVDPSARVFLMRASLMGIPMAGLHTFTGAEARMRIRIASVLQLVDGVGEEMNQGETVTIFNDLCFMAPAALLDVPVRWTALGPCSAQGAFTRGDKTVTAVLTFDETGDLTDFVSHDRFMSADGKSFERHPWSTPARGHREVDGLRLPTAGDIVWKLPAGDFTYGEFHMTGIRYF